MTIVAPGGVENTDPTPVLRMYGEDTLFAGMYTRVHAGPEHVSFANCYLLESSNDASNAEGIFDNKAPAHQPSRTPMPLNQNLKDEAAIPIDRPREGEFGSFDWMIPTHYLVGGQRVPFPNSPVRQRFDLRPLGHLAVLTVSKGSAETSAVCDTRGDGNDG